MEFPAVDPAVLSEYGIDKQVLLGIAEAPFEIDGTPGRDKPALFNVNEVGIPGLQNLALLVQTIDRAEGLGTVAGIVFHVDVARFGVHVQHGHLPVLSRVAQRAAIILPLVLQGKIVARQLLQRSRTVAVGHPHQRRA